MKNGVFLFYLFICFSTKIKKMSVFLLNDHLKLIGSFYDYKGAFLFQIPEK
jgi:hypothetical protein